ncbi:MAG TPA: YicC family protein [Clostridiales bacterium]|nr:YicC family protein [Clostridiales bacterium]
MYSMTGYGKAEYRENGIELIVELKTVNNRFLDILPKYPRSFISLDDFFRKTISAKLNRGRCELFITFNDKREKPFEMQVDLSVAKAYVDGAKSLKQAFPELENDLTVCSLMRIPDVCKSSLSEDDLTEIKPLILQTLNQALDNLNAMRYTEGEKLKENLLFRVGEVEKYLLEIEKYAPLVADDYTEKMQNRIQKYLDGVDVDQSRLLQETAIFADKSNIDEEIARLKSHISQFRHIIDDVTAGRKLDFLIQEFNREANTICSKACNVNITNLGLKLKCEIEKIREQIQNLE